jgi:hypothetical protein
VSSVGDYRIRIQNVADTDDLATTIMDDHGFNFDASRGDFETVVPEKGVVHVVARDVAKGDIEGLVDDLLEKHGDLEWDVARREPGSNTGWYPVDLDDDDD